MDVVAPTSATAAASGIANKRRRNGASGIVEITTAATSEERRDGGDDDNKNAVTRGGGGGDPFETDKMLEMAAGDPDALAEMQKQKATIEVRQRDAQRAMEDDIRVKNVIAAHHENRPNAAAATANTAGSVRFNDAAAPSAAEEQAHLFGAFYEVGMSIAQARSKAADCGLTLRQYFDLLTMLKARYGPTEYKKVLGFEESNNPAQQPTASSAAVDRPDYNTTHRSSNNAASLSSGFIITARGGDPIGFT